MVDKYCSDIHCIHSLDVEESQLFEQSDVVAWLDLTSLNSCYVCCLSDFFKPKPE